MLELPSNPGKFIQSRAIIGQDGYVHAAVRNNSPVAVGGIRVKVEYIDTYGKLREFGMTFRQTFKAAESAVLPTKIRDIADLNELQRRVRVTVIGARVVEESRQKK